MASFPQPQDEPDEAKEVPAYARDELLYLTKLYDKAERYEEAIQFASEFIRLKPILNSDERQCFASSFKNQLCIKRQSLRYLNSLLKKESQRSSVAKNKVHISDIISKVEEEYNIIIAEMHNLLENFLIPNSKKTEAQVFYLKLKADYFRYKAEFAKAEEKDMTVDLAEQAYNDAYMLSEEGLPITSLNRIGLALNFSLFYYEMKGMIEEAIIIAKNCFDEAIKVVDDIEPDKAKDYILIVQLLKENSLFLTNEKADEEDA